MIVIYMFESSRVSIDHLKGPIYSLNHEYISKSILKVTQVLIQ